MSPPLVTTRPLTLFISGPLSSATWNNNGRRNLYCTPPHGNQDSPLVLFYQEQKRDINTLKEQPTSWWDHFMRGRWECLDVTSRSFSAVTKELDGDLARTVSCPLHIPLEHHTAKERRGKEPGLKLGTLRVLSGFVARVVWQDTCSSFWIGFSLFNIHSHILHRPLWAWHYRGWYDHPGRHQAPVLRSFHIHIVTPGWNYDGCDPTRKAASSWSNTMSFTRKSTPSLPSKFLPLNVSLPNLTFLQVHVHHHWHRPKHGNRHGWRSQSNHHWQARKIHAKAVLLILTSWGYQ